jgi:predicted phosphoribosyltransferase
MRQPFVLLKDRRDAGQRLAGELARFAGQQDTVILGLPRGGVVVAFEVARALDLPLDIYLVRKLGTPGQEELAMGAIASGGVMVLNDDVVRTLHLGSDSIEQVAERERTVLEKREATYRGHAEAVPLEGKQVILIDDGLATGATMRTAIKSLRAHGPARIIVAVPTAPAETCTSLAKEVDEMVCSMTPSPFFAIGEWYEDFSQTSDEEVVALLEEARSFGRPGAAEARSLGRPGAAAVAETEGGA